MNNLIVKSGYNPALADKALSAKYEELHQKLDYLIKLVETFIPQQTKETQTDELT